MKLSNLIEDKGELEEIKYIFEFHEVEKYCSH